MERDPEVYWVIPNKLAGRPGPGLRPWDLGTLRAMGIRTVVTLDDRGVYGREILGAGLNHRPIRVPDFTAPKQEQLEEFCRFVDRETAEGRPVLTCCYAGRGRTGTMAAAYLIWRGHSSDEAIREVRRGQPKAVEAPEQEEALRTFESRHRGRGTGPPKDL